MSKMWCRCYQYAVFGALVTFTCFLGPRAGAVTVGRCPAFVAGHSRVPLAIRESQLIRVMASTDDETDGASRAETTRRECIGRSFLQAASVMGVATTAPWNKISVAEAATVTTTEPQELQQAALQSWLCDPTVSSWKKQGRTVHIVGTSHLSSVSADLAGNVVREVQVRTCLWHNDIHSYKQACCSFA